MTRVQANWPFKMSQEVDKVIYTLQADHLNENQCHIFLCGLTMELILGSAIEYLCCNPAHPILEKKFELYRYESEGLEVQRMAFPIEYMGILENIAKIEGGAIVSKTRGLILGERSGKLSLIRFPKANNVKFFEGPKLSSNEIEARYEECKFFGNLEHRLGID